VFLPCPQPPDWVIDWAALDQLPWLQGMKGCPQHPDRHAEGDVWTHVHLVTEAMVALPAWRELPEADRRILFAAALLHDVAKPACTRVESDGRITSRGHSWRGAVQARRILWRLGVPFAEREAVCAIVRHHLVPFFLAGSENPRRLAIEVSQTARCDHLAVMAEADVRGRVCPDPQKLLDQVALFREYAIDTGCLSLPFTFPSDHARFLYFRDPTRTPDAPAHEEFHARVVMLGGLPGAGKDRWLEKNLPGWPTVSLDSIRQELGVPPSDPQGEVLHRARELARDHLRNGRDFVWNATSLSRHVRGECIRLFHGYDAHLRIVYVETTPERLFAQNRQRRNKVPEKVIERLLDRWEVPDRTEGHAVEYVVRLD
jgi:predicted kinase